MVDILYRMPSFLLFIITSFSCMLIAIILTKCVHKYIPLKFRYEENQAIVCVSALIGIIYAVLVGFVVLYELNNFNKASEAESAEAKAAFDIFRLAHVLPEPMSQNIRKFTVNYIENAIQNEWPLMAQGSVVNDTGITAIENISKELRSFNIDNLSITILQTLNSLSINSNKLFDAHQERVSKIHTALSANIWFVLILGTLLTIGINCILGMEPRLHLVCIIFISLIVAAVLYLIITLDRPYRGDFSIQPNTFIYTLEYINLKADLI